MEDINNTSIPNFLYRGVIIKYDKLNEFRFFDDLKPYGEPIIDSQGRKLIGDGNEYGIYMTDNKEMALNAYGNVHSGGVPINQNIKVSSKLITIPDVGIVYKINTKNLSVKEPFITKQMKGHYNNGYEGKEYITDLIPKENYEVIRVRIGEDYLHDIEDITLDNLDSQIKNKLEIRKYRLELLANTLLNIPEFKRSQFGKKEQELFRDIFGENGIRYVQPNNIDTSNCLGVLKYLLYTYYNKSPYNIDFKSLLYIESLKDKINNLENIDGLINHVKKDLTDNLEEKNEFIRKKGNLSPSSFDNKNKMLESVLEQILKLKESQVNILDPKEDENLNLRYNFSKKISDMGITLNDEYLADIFKIQEIDDEQEEQVEQFGRKLR